jgi:starch phosphorylase
MVNEYMSQLYEPAHLGFVEMSQNNFDPARERARWNWQVNQVWDRVNFVEFGPGPDATVLNGRPIPMRAVLDLAGLTAKDVRVEAVIGRVGVNGQLEETQVMTLLPVEQKGNAVVFSKEFVPHQTGRLGYSLRVSPNHYDDPLTRPCHALLKWGAG